MGKILGYILFIFSFAFLLVSGFLQIFGFSFVTSAVLLFIAVALAVLGMFARKYNSVPREMLLPINAARATGAGIAIVAAGH